MWIKIGIAAAILLVVGFVGLVAVVLGQAPIIYQQLAGMTCLVALLIGVIAIRKSSAAEYDVLLALADGEPTGIDIVKRVSELTGRQRRISFGRLYLMLLRFEHQGFVESRWGVATGERGGNRPRHYKLTEAGRGLLRS